MEKKENNSKICPECGSEMHFARPPGWCSEEKWICLKCSNVEKIKNKQQKKEKEMEKGYIRHKKERDLAICELSKEGAGGWGPGWTIASFQDENRIKSMMSKIFREKGVDFEKLDNFMDKFSFHREGSLKIGIERECFITDLKGNIIPASARILSVLADRSRFGYELSACQLEDRIGPVGMEGLRVSLYANEMILRWAEAAMNFRRMSQEVAPENMPLDVYPDPTGRYQEITKNMPRNILEAACRVTGTHVHIGMPDHGTALKVYNKVIEETEKLCILGDGSNRERLRIYKVMAPDFHPPHYRSWIDFYETAVKKDFTTDPRKCWNLIRISVHGTIEFRMFGATPDLDKIIGWARACHDLCKTAME